MLVPKSKEKKNSMRRKIMKRSRQKKKHKVEEACNKKKAG
jgi:hypothetical protein